MPEKEVSTVIELNEDLLANNNRLAEQNSKDLQDLKIKSIDFVGAIGAGKTALIEVIVKRISGEYRILVINGDVTTRIDADRINQHGVNTIQINTGRECSLNSYHISQVIKNQDLRQTDILFIENVGNLICPSDFILGTDKRVVIVSITEGPWVIRKHPMLFKSSDIAVINKIDLIDVMDVNIEEMIRDAEKINPHLKIFTTSALTGENIQLLINELFI
ncbi:MAG: hydrogenase nickel incorporation protein HypB [Promethearchaeota archaeon]|jgi:hydrogenase nickel incorporation protein HypB